MHVPWIACSEMMNTDAEETRCISSNRRPAPIDLNPQARHHHLFPLLDYVVKKVHDNHQTLQRIEQKISQREKDFTSLRSAVQELKELQEQNNVQSFSLKLTGYEKPLRCGVADLLCDSLTRDVRDEDLSNLVKKVLKSECKHRYKVDAALKYCKKMVSIFKTEERRRILGVPPCQAYKELDTNSLAKVLMDYLKASDTKSMIYRKHLEIIRKFVREENNPREIKSFYAAFKQWKVANYPSEIDWDTILAEDQAFCYNNEVTIPAHGDVSPHTSSPGSTHPSPLPQEDNLSPDQDDGSFSLVGHSLCNYTS